MRTEIQTFHREVNLLELDWFPLILHLQLESSVPGKIIYYQVCLVKGGKSFGTRLVSLNPPATTGIIRPRKDILLSGMFSKGR